METLRSQLVFHTAKHFQSIHSHQSVHYLTRSTGAVSLQAVVYNRGREYYRKQLWLENYTSKSIQVNT